MPEKGKKHKKNFEIEELTQKEYQESHRFWADKVLTQFGTANNFFIAIGLALLAYFVKELEHFESIQFGIRIKDSDLKVTFLVFAILFAFASLFSGSLTLLSRLYDLRLTRHTTYIRTKIYERKKNLKGLPAGYIDIKKDLKFPKFQAILFYNFIHSVLTNDYFLNEQDQKDKEVLSEKFYDLRKRTLMLGRFSWITFKWQIFWVATALSSSIISWIL